MANHYIRQTSDGRWVILQKRTGVVLSRHDTKEDAEASFRAMEANKHGRPWTHRGFGSPRVL